MLAMDGHGVPRCRCQNLRRFLQELHGPEHEETQASRSNLERFQQEHGSVL